VTFFTEMPGCTLVGKASQRDGDLGIVVNEMSVEIGDAEE
jgi:hypothetical protein